MKNSHQKIGQFYMPHDDVDPITTPEDVVLLARRLINYRHQRLASMDNVSVRDVLERAGEHQQWEGKEASIVSKALGEVGKDYIDPGHHSDNINIAVALARTFASGRINENDDEAALLFAKERVRRFKSVNDHSIDYPRQKMKLSELLQFLENLKIQKPEYIKELYDIRMLSKEEKERRFDENENWIATPDHFFMKEAAKYGLVNRSHLDILSLRTVLIWYALGFEPNSLESTDVIAVIRSILMQGTSKDERPHFVDDLE